jgi:hypothetical protein
MEKLNLTNFGVQEMNTIAMSEIEGGSVPSSVYFSLLINKVSGIEISTEIKSMVSPTTWTAIKVNFGSLLSFSMYGL